MFNGAGGMNATKLISNMHEKKKNQNKNKSMNMFRQKIKMKK